jgi:hypothetical protein
MPRFPRIPEQEARSGRAWRGWLAPAAAAASVALIIGLAVALTGAAGHAGSRTPSPSGGTTPGFPKYFVHDDRDQTGLLLEVRSTSTAALAAMARLPDPRGWAAANATLAASPDGRTFYAAVEKTPLHGVDWDRISIYRLSITAPERTARLTRIHSGKILGDDDRGDRMAVSPDGTKLALTAQSGS